MPRKKSTKRKTPPDAIAADSAFDMLRVGRGEAKQDRKPAARSKAPASPQHNDPPPAPSPEEPKGLRCRNCGCAHFKTYYTRPKSDGSVARRKQCRHCGRMISTRERPV
jgi:hypothetical protein